MLVRGFEAISLLGGLGVEEHLNGLTSLGSSVFCDTHEKPRFMQDGALLYLCFMLVRGFVAISLLGGMGVEDHQNGLMPLGSSVFRDTQEKPRFMHTCTCLCVALQPFHCWVDWAWRTTRMVLRRLAVPSFVILRKNRALCKMEHYHICSSCWCVVFQPLHCWLDWAWKTARMVSAA